MLKPFVAFVVELFPISMTLTANEFFFFFFIFFLFRAIFTLLATATSSQCTRLANYFSLLLLIFVCLSLLGYVFLAYFFFIFFFYFYIHKRHEHKKNLIWSAKNKKPTINVIKKYKLEKKHVKIIQSENKRMNRSIASKPKFNNIYTP